MKVSAQFAEEHFADILHAADSGEEVEIELSGRPALLLSRRSEAVPFRRTTPRVLGEGVGEMAVPSWEEWKAFDKQLEQEASERPLISGGL